MDGKEEVVKKDEWNEKVKFWAKKISLLACLEGLEERVS